MDVQSGCLSRHGEKTSLKVDNFQGERVTRPDEWGWVKDRGDARSASDLESPRGAGHVDLEYTKDIDRKLLSEGG